MKKETKDIQIGGIPLKLIMRIGKDGKIVDLMEKPDLKHIPPEAFVSCIHQSPNPKFKNHYDHFVDGKKSEIIIPQGAPLPYGISGGMVTSGTTVVFRLPT